MAPLAATLVATVVLGVGVALLRSKRERRARERRRERERGFAPLRGEPLGAGLRRMALGQLDVAAEALAHSEAPPEERVHETRKALKRLRALLRLRREELGEPAYARETALLRDTGRRLAGARDAAVLLATLDGLIERYPGRLAGRRGVLRLRERLLHERAGAAERALAKGGAQALADLGGLRARVEMWRPAEGEAIAWVEPALEQIYRAGRKRLRRAARAKGPRRRARTLHEWRKRVKDLRYAEEMLGASKQAKRADDLGELLGEEHDLAVLAERVRREAREGTTGRGTRKALLRAIGKRRRKLRRRALREGERLYARKPRRFLRRMRKASALGAPSRR